MVMNIHLIHGQQDGLVDWPYKVHSHNEMGLTRNELAAHEADEAKPKMFVMRHRKVERCFEMFADIIEKKDRQKKFHEQFGKFLKRAIHEDSTNH